MGYYAGYCPDCKITVECMCEGEMRAPHSGSCSNQGQTFSDDSMEEPGCAALERKACKGHDSCRWLSKTCLGPGPAGCEHTVRGKLKQARNKAEIDLPSGSTCGDCRRECAAMNGMAGFKFGKRRKSTCVCYG